MDTISFITKSLSCDVRYLPLPPKAVMTIYDGKKIISILDPKMRQNEGAAILVQNPSLVNLLQEHFEILWITVMEKPQYNLDSSQE